MHVLYIRKTEGNKNALLLVHQGLISTKTNSGFWTLGPI